MKNASLKTKYVVVFLGAAMVSYALIFAFIYARTMRYEMSNLQHFLDNSMEQAKNFVESETKMVAYASDTLYYTGMSTWYWTDASMRLTGIRGRNTGTGQIFPIL